MNDLKPGDKVVCISNEPALPLLYGGVYIFLEYMVAQDGEMSIIIDDKRQGPWYISRFEKYIDNDINVW